VPAPPATPTDRAHEARRLGHLAEAEALYREAMRRDPRQTAVVHALAEMLEDAGQVDAAIAVLHEGLRHAPDHAPSHHYLGILHAIAKRHADSIAHIERAVAIKPDYPIAWNNLGNALRSAGRLADAEAAFTTALRLRPDYAIARFNLCGALRLQGRFAEAEPALRELLRAQPRHRDALLALAAVLQQLARPDEAADAYRQAIALAPDDADARMKLWAAEQEMCDWTHHDELVRALKQRLRDPGSIATPPLVYLYLPCTPAEQLAAARRWAAARIEVEPPAAPASAQARGERMRIGYLSSDLRQHPMAALVTELLERHDREQVEVFAYAYGPDDGSAERRRIMRAVDHWRDIAADPDADAAQRIRADRLHVLLDLNGYTRFSRSDIPALRPAPLQMSWLGYLGSLGAPWYDYIITDRFVSPPGQQVNFDERFLYLPNCYCPSDTRRETGARVPGRAECALPQDGFVFCCFNSPQKILPDVFAVWMRLLRAVPGSVLWLAPDHRATVANLRRAAQRAGVAPERIVIAARVPLAEHLARLRCADLFLDTFPYNAGATANDALLAGVPVLTCSGETFASRIAGSQLHAIGLPELVTCASSDYEALGLRLAREPGLLEGFRTRLAANRHTHPLFDMPGFVRDFEAALAGACGHAQLPDGARPAQV
jgi:predicted O-linked N-acetylglucosamine transferase (SPINDLY family)